MIKNRKPKFNIGDVLKVTWIADDNPIVGIIKITDFDRNCYVFKHLNLHRQMDMRGYNVIEDLVKGEKLENGALFYGK